MDDMINERDKEFANEFSRFVNGKMGSASKLGAVTTQHPYGHE